TRQSGPMLEAALSAGFASMGIDVVSIGVAPTPAVAYAARTGHFGLGVIVSASHNPAPDNGIKFVTHEGVKSTDEQELEWEGRMEAGVAHRGVGGEVGTITASTEPLDAYAQFLVGLVPEGLHGMRVAVDTAHGAAYALAPRVLKALGAETIVVGDRPDGMNINADGGATKPDTIQALTRITGVDVGVAFDGDADRAVFSDGQGRLINGDRTLGIWAAHRQGTGRLMPPIVVGTVMSNGGFEQYLAGLGIRLERTPVGDKHVASRIRATGALCGGEQSGHLIFPDHQPTGDGLLTMLELLRTLCVSGRSATSCYDDYRAWPQLLVNVGASSTDGWKETLADRLEEAETRLLGHGRLLVRPSGTQPMLRIMVEAEDERLRDEITDSLVQAAVERMGGHVEGRVDLTHA
ncbi:phosphoglucosamine mutase, partial [bacterium]